VASAVISTAEGATATATAFRLAANEISKTGLASAPQTRGVETSGTLSTGSRDERLIEA
jgi:hypothetical protein